MTDAYFDNGTVRLFQADARAIPLPDESVDCVVTSPPYWGLRNYGLEPTVWGGGECEHEWGGPTQPSTKLGFGGNTDGTYAGGVVDPGKAHATTGVPVAGSFCTRCTAWLGTLGLEPLPELYVEHLVEVFREVRRVLKPTGTVWCNMGDSYNGSGGAGGDYNEGGLKAGQPKYPGRNVGSLKPKDLVGIPWRVAFALQADGWWLRSDIIWSKPNPMPESVTDRPTKAHEYLFLLTKAANYYYDQEAVREQAQDWGTRDRSHWAYTSEEYRQTSGDIHRGNFEDINFAQRGRNRRSVWEIATQPYPDAHFATFPEALVEPCILAGTSERGNCPKCGTPWQRQVEKIPTGETQKMPDGMATYPGDHGTIHKNGREQGRSGNPVMASKTIGWHAACACKGTPGLVSAVVLDPFAGSGTVGVVAQKLGRHAVLVEASEEYCELAVKRLSAVPLPLMAQAARVRHETA